MKPKVLILPSIIYENTKIYENTNILSLNNSYAEAILKNGAMPFIGNFDENIFEYLEIFDGILLTGGQDVDPQYYGQTLHEKTNIVQKKRDRLEIELIKNATKKNKSLLCICRGIQVLNVALGGTLHQHIEEHNFPEERENIKHQVKIIDKTKLFDIYKTNQIGTNSIHHQTIAEVPKIIKISGFSEDGQIEAIEIPSKKFIIGVQWHPEALFKSYEIHNNIFKRFVQSLL